MWIKNLNLFQADAPFDMTPADVESALADALCPQCGSQTLSTAGFAPPVRGESAMSWHVDGIIHALHQEMTRLLPSAVVNEELDNRIEAIEHGESRTVGRKERGDMKDQLVFELLPRAFPRSRFTHVLIDLRNGQIWVDTAAVKRAEEIISTLRDALGSLPVKPVDTAVAPTAILTQWLRRPESMPEGLTLGDGCELRDDGDTRAAVRCSAVDLHQAEIQAHLDAGMAVTRLNLCWDEALEFNLTEQLVLKNMRPLDRVNDELEAMDAEDAVAELQATIALQAGALRPLLACLGKVLETGQAQAVRAA